MFKKLCMLAVFVTITIVAFSQKSPLPANHPVALAAPHLPLIVRHDGSGAIFYAEKFTYKSEINVSNLNDWIKNYPSEVISYKDAIAQYFKSTDSAKLTSDDADQYFDLKAQYLMFQQINY